MSADPDFVRALEYGLRAEWAHRLANDLFSRRIASKIGADPAAVRAQRPKSGHRRIGDEPAAEHLQHYAAANRAACEFLIAAERSWIAWRESPS
jgi:hypothetical protein